MHYSTKARNHQLVKNQLLIALLKIIHAFYLNDFRFIFLFTAPSLSVFEWLTMGNLTT